MLKLNYFGVIIKFYNIQSVKRKPDIIRGFVRDTFWIFNFHVLLMLTACNQSNFNNEVSNNKDVEMEQQAYGGNVKDIRQLYLNVAKELKIDLNNKNNQENNRKLVLGKTIERAMDQAEGHIWIVLQALNNLNQRGILPEELKGADAAFNLIFGAFFADNTGIGRPERYLKAAENERRVKNPADKFRSVQKIQTTDAFSKSCAKLATKDIVYHASLEQGYEPANGEFPSTYHRSKFTLRANVVEVLNLGSDTEENFSTDNLMHYGLGESASSKLGKFSSYVQIFPSTAKEYSLNSPIGIVPGGVFLEDALASCVANDLRGLSTVVDSELGLSKYGSLLYQLSRRFFDNQTNWPKPNINELVKSGNTDEIEKGWKNGALDGGYPLDSSGKPTTHFRNFRVDFPHTYLGGNPFICIPGGKKRVVLYQCGDGQYQTSPKCYLPKCVYDNEMGSPTRGQITNQPCCTPDNAYANDCKVLSPVLPKEVEAYNFDSCADGQPTWPVWVPKQYKTEYTDDEWNQQLAEQSPDRSNSAAQIYLGWAAHMIEDSNLPYHAANWTGRWHAAIETGKELIKKCIDLPECKYDRNPYKQFNEPINEPCCTPDSVSRVCVPKQQCTKYEYKDQQALFAKAFERFQEKDYQNKNVFCEKHGISDKSLAVAGINWQASHTLFRQALERGKAKAAASPMPTPADVVDHDVIGNAIVDTMILFYCAPPRTVYQQNQECTSGLCKEKVVKDFDGDRKTDQFVFRPSDGTWHIRSSKDGNENTIQFGIASDRMVPGDYDGDGRTDVAVFRPSNGTWYVRPSNGGNDRVTQFGLSSDLPIPGDYDGDRKTDVAVFRSSNGTWYIRPSNGGDDRETQYGLSSDLPIPGDYDGDGRTDVAVFRPSNGTWYIRPSNGGNDWVTQFGLSSDLPTPGDYDGDGKTDVAVFRPSNGTWYVRPSNGGNDRETQFGVSSDRPVPGDYDGDGKTDVAIFRPSNGTWYIRPANGSPDSVVQLGKASDIVYNKL